MRKLSKSVRGVTLLEVMLVLAIAAMIVVMSIRYYSSAQTSQQASASMQQLQSVMAAMDTMGMAGGYSSNATQSKLSAIVGANNMLTTTGGAITLGAMTATTYAVTMVLSPAICPAVASNLANNKKITSATCVGGTLTMNYDNTK